MAAGESSTSDPNTDSGELAEPPLHAGILVTLVSLGFMIHAAKTGRFMPWFYIILFLPGIGAMAYVVVELVPQWFGSSGAQRTRRQLATSLNPTGRYRQLQDELSVVDTIANRAALAEECLRLGKFEEAKLLERPGRFAELLLEKRDRAADAPRGDAIIRQPLDGAQGDEIPKVVKALAPARPRTHQPKFFPVAEAARIKSQDAANLPASISLCQAGGPPRRAAFRE